jgi:hypothetical protein
MKAPKVLSRAAGTVQQHIRRTFMELDHALYVSVFLYIWLKFFLEPKERGVGLFYCQYSLLSTQSLFQLQCDPSPRVKKYLCPTTTGSGRTLLNGTGDSTRQLLWPQVAIMTRLLFGPVLPSRHTAKIYF